MIKYISDYCSFIRARTQGADDGARPPHLTFVDCPQFLFEERPQPQPVAIGEIGGKRAVARLQIGHHAGKADAGVAFEDLLDRQLDAAFGETFLIGADRQQLAVDQDAVAVEDHEIEPHRRSHRRLGQGDDDRDVVDRAARQHQIEQPLGRLARCGRTEFARDLAIGDHVGQPVAA